MARTRSNRELNDNELARILFREVERTSIRDVAARIGIGKSTLDNLLYSAKQFPKAESIEKIADYLEKPAYEVWRLAGFDVELPSNVDQGAALMQLARDRPELRRLIRQLPKLTPQQVQSLLVYLEALRTEELRAELRGELRGDDDEG